MGNFSGHAPVECKRLHTLTALKMASNFTKKCMKKVRLFADRSKHNKYEGFAGPAHYYTKYNCYTNVEIKMIYLSQPFPLNRGS